MRTAADSVVATEWLEMGGEKKPLEISELGCADGCGREMGGENSADGCGRRGCQGVAGNGWGEEAAGDERAWLRGQLRTGNGCRELRRRLRTAWVQRSGWKMLEMGGEKKPLVMSELGCADGCGREMGAENCADGCGRRGCQGVAGNGWGEEAAGDQRACLYTDGCGREMVRRTPRTAADGVGARGWLEMGGEKKPLVMSELGCADGCGWQMGAENCADGCGRRGCNGVAGNGWGEEAAGDQRAWLRGRLRTGNGWGELRGRLRTAWVPGSGWK